jgi:hypothetical protein
MLDHRLPFLEREGVASIPRPEGRANKDDQVIDFLESLFDHMGVAGMEWLKTSNEDANLDGLGKAHETPSCYGEMSCDTRWTPQRSPRAFRG